METMPMPLDALGAANGGLEDFRVTAPREIGVMLKQLCDGSVQVNLNASDGSVISATVWTMDATRGSLGFSVDANDPALQSLLECQEVVVVGYLESVKLQFDVHNLVLVHGSRGSVLNCGYPRELFRFQRRGAYRVRPLRRDTPVARMRHTEIAEMQLALRVLDVSIGGCALFLPDDVPAIQPGSVLNQVQIDLDADTRFHVNLRLQHVTSLNQDMHGVRLGCEFVRADAGALRALQRFIDQTQKRGRLVSLD
jgi:flagellar brake protein